MQMSNSFSPFDTILQTANVLGVEYLDPVDEHEGPFYVIKTRHYYGQIDRSEFVKDNESNPRKFITYHDAYDWTTEELIRQRTYHVSNNEQRPPSYTIVSVPDISAAA